jgi:histone-lysine N-methyltransferase SETMAR
VRDFVSDLARASKGFSEIKKTVDAAFGDKTLKRAAIYKILNAVKEGKNTDDQRHLNGKKTKRTPALITSVSAAVEEDRRQTITALATAFGVSTQVIFSILHDDLGLVKKSARWVPKLLSNEQKQELVRLCEEFISAVLRRCWTTSSRWTNRWCPITCPRVKKNPNSG